MDYLGRWFWVCNGEKTTVKAVGQDGAQGEPGKDAQPEVKRKTASGICGTVQNLKNLPALLLQQMFLTTTLILLILTTTLSWLFVTKTVRMKICSSALERRIGSDYCIGKQFQYCL